MSRSKRLWVSALGGKCRLDALGARDCGVTGVCCALGLFSTTGRGITGLARDPGPVPRDPRSEMVRRYSAGEGPAAGVGVHGDGDAEPMPTAADAFWAARGSRLLSGPENLSPGIERWPSASARDS